MSIYLLNLAFILILAWPLCIYRPSATKKILYLCLTFGALFFLSLARFGIGNDYFRYIEYYQQVGAAQNWQEIFAVGIEKGYLILCKIMQVCHFSDTTMMAAFSLLCLVPAAWFIYRYSPNIWLSVWLYVTLTFFYGTLNFVRQNLAAAILMLGYPLLRRKKPISILLYIGVIFAACLFHKTALFMLFVLPFCYLKPSRRLYLIYGLGTIFLYLTSNFFIDFVTDYIYQSYKNSIYLNFGLGYHFLIVPALVVFLCLITYRYQRTLYEDAPLILNLIFFSALIWLFITKHMVLERFSLYIYFYVLLGVPMACESLRPNGALLQKYMQAKEKVRLLSSTQPKSGSFKKSLNNLREIKEKLFTQRMVYTGVILGVLVVTFIYHVFGMYDGTNGFHGVFPYQSWISILNQLP